LRTVHRVHLWMMLTATGVSQSSLINVDDMTRWQRLGDWQSLFNTNGSKQQKIHTRDN